MIYKSVSGSIKDTVGHVREKGPSPLKCRCSVSKKYCRDFRAHPLRGGACHQVDATNILSMILEVQNDV